MEDLPLGRIAAFVSEFAVKDLPLSRTLMMMMMMQYLIAFLPSPAKLIEVTIFYS